jgi:hypothetical protein
MSGSFSVLDATYFCMLFNTAVKGLSFLWGQTAYKSSYVRRPRRRPPASAMLPPRCCIAA